MSPRRTRPNRTLTGGACQECGQRIVFVKMTVTGKRVPVDPIPVADGNVCARLIGQNLHGYVISADHPAELPFHRFAAHFGTCPDRAKPMRGMTERRAGRYREPPPALFDL